MTIWNTRQIYFITLRKNAPGNKGINKFVQSRQLSTAFIRRLDPFFRIDYPSIQKNTKKKKKKKESGNILVTRNPGTEPRYKRANKIVIVDKYPTLNGSQPAER